MHQQRLAEGGTKIMERGELYTASLDPVVGSEQGGTRPVLIVQNDVGNRFSPTVIVLAVTSQLHKARLPTHVAVGGDDCGLTRESVVLAEQVRTIDKRRLKERIGQLPPDVMARVSAALRVSLEL
ncbi:MAG: type II toxin-antitoxin system PemK/MazF family toxin [Clostridia bacterium]